jgi:hypothetical protein
VGEALPARDPSRGQATDRPPGEYHAAGAVLAMIAPREIMSFRKQTCEYIIGASRSASTAQTARSTTSSRRTYGF